MPKFLDFNSINKTNPEKLLKSIDKYRQVISYQFNKSNMIFLYQPDEKSALLDRIFHDKPLFIVPPPLSFSYPAYFYLEQKETEITFFDEEKLFDLDKHNTILIGQNTWMILKKTKDYFLLSTQSWKDKIQWKLYNKTIALKDSQHKLISYHDKSIDHITTLEQLKKEMLFQIHDELIGIRMNQNEKIAQEQKEKLKDSPFSEYFYLQKMKIGKELLEKRLSHHLSAYPEEKEINQLLNERLNDFFQRGFSIKDNEILKNVFILERVQDNIEQFYLKM